MKVSEYEDMIVEVNNMESNLTRDGKTVADLDRQRNLLTFARAQALVRERSGSLDMKTLAVLNNMKPKKRKQLSQKDKVAAKKKRQAARKARKVTRRNRK